jgi:hypothetical protein
LSIENRRISPKAIENAGAYVLQRTGDTRETAEFLYSSFSAS